MFTVFFYKKQGGEYRLMPFKSPARNFCDFLNDDLFFYKSFSEVTDFPYPLACPLKAGVYEVRGYAPSLKNTPFTILQEGDYMGEASITKKGKTYWKAQLFVNVVYIP